ncbi:MAG TPA: hypothetical protein VF622_12155 [Segetibacter sp.]|jgi:hypothetical protein
MNTEQLEEGQLNLLILMEEFRYWDASRNKVPEIELDEIKMKIKKMKKIKVSEFKQNTN